MKKHILFILAILFLTINSLSAQNAIIGSGFGTNDWATIDYYNAGAGTSRIGIFTANGTGNQYFRSVIAWSGNNDEYTITNGSDVQVNKNIEYTPNQGPTTSGAMYFNVSNSSYNYVFKTPNGGDPPPHKLIIFEVQGDIRTVSAVSRSPINVGDNQNVTITANLDAVLNTGQSVYLRYTDDNWTNSTIVEMSFSTGTNYVATIPNTVNIADANIDYYVFTSGDGLTITGANADWFTINLNNNAGSNYSYSVAYTTAQNGDWNITTTWTAGVVPPADAGTQINHDITINAAVANNPARIEITAGNSITFGASGDITINTSITNDGTIDMTSGGSLAFANNTTFTNNSTFTGGTGDVVFNGAGTVSGATIFNNIEIKGAVDLGASANLDGILTINGGNLSNNSITYNLGSTLKYAANYDINSGDKSWYSNVASTGVAQEGIPCNVEITTGVTVQLNDSYPFSINGNILIDGSFRLGTDGSTHWGNFLLRGNFTNNGTFTPNDREITFNGTSPQTLTGATTFAYFKMDGSGSLTLNNDITITKTLNFANGKITLGTNNITVDATAGSISGGNSSSYAITDGTGYLIQNVGSSEKTFPVGTATSYAPAYLTQAGTQENLYVQVKAGIDNTTNDDDFTVNLQWTIDEETAGSNNITTKFQWNETDENTYFDNQGQVKIGRYITGSYSSSAATVAGSNPFTASATSMADDISAEIPFIIGNTMAFSASGYRTAQNGNWATNTTWIGGTVPPANAVCMILHHITVNSTLNNADEVNIYENKSVTFQASGDLTVNGTFINHGMLKTEDATSIISINGTLKNTSTASANMIGGGTLKFTNGSIFTNNGSFTAGTGTVDFAGAGTATGTLVFNNLNISGNVDLGATASLNNILTLSGGGDLTNNSIKYLTGSVLKFDQNYSLADNKIWYRNVDANGNSQVGIPWNVEVLATRTVDISDAFFRAINGNLLINGTFVTSSSAGGDFKLKGNFENNGTYTHNSRQVEFYGNQNQKIKGSLATTFAYLKINNTANVTLENTCTIANDLDFTNGKLILGTNNLTVSGAINSADATKYVVTNDIGNLIQNVGTTEKTFPIGTLSGYNPAYLTETTAENYSIRVKNSIDNVVNDPTQIVNVQWTIDNNAVNADNVTIKLQWNSTDQASGFTAGTDDIAYYSGSYNNANATTSGLTASRTIASSITNTPTPFIVAEAAAFSGGIYTIANGDWNVAGTWNGGTIPGTGQSARILHNVNLNTFSPTVKSISISSGKTLDCNGQTITLDDGGAIANSGTFLANGGKVVFSGAGSISSGLITFNDVDLNGAVSFGSSTIIDGVLSINSGGSVNTNAPVYGTSSTLKYNQGGAIARSYEWQYNIAETDPGYPANVQISNNTTLDVDADNNDDNYYQTRFLKGNLTIDAGSEISLNDMGGGTSENQICGVYAKGNILNNGTITLSSSFGGDMMLEGDIINTGTVNWNSRAIFFTGDNNLNQNITGLATIPFVLITRGANLVLQNDMTVNGSGSEFITFARPSSTNTGSIDLNGNTLTCSGSGNIELNDISGAEVTSSVANGRIEVSGGNATYSGIGSGTLNFGTTSSTDVTLAINGGIMTFPATLGIITVYGTLEIGDGATITNIPTYGNNSTLHYKKEGSYTMGVEWGTGSDVADNIPKNVTVSQGSTASILNMNANRYALGTLLIENNATLEVADAIGQLTVNNLTVDAGGTIVLKSPSDNGVAGSLITTGTVTNNGTMQAERYISGGKYVFVSPPNNVTNSQLFTNNSNGYFNPNFLYYNQAFEAPSDPATATYAEWNLPANNFEDAWITAHDGEGGTGILLNAPGKGYAYFNDINKMFTFDGTFNTGDINTTIYFDTNDGNSDYFDGWNLIANPYPSALDWNDASWDKTDVDASIYYWDGTSGTAGNYKYYVASTYDDGTNVVNGGSQFIPATQAFFVKAKNTVPSVTGKSFTIPNDARKHNTQDFWGKNFKKSKNNISQFIRIQVNANGLEDELVARFINEATENYDGQFDAYKVYSSTKEIPQVYSYNEITGAGFALNSLPLSSINNKLKLGIEIAKRGETSCTLKLSEFNITGKHIYLEDKAKKSIQNLRNNSEYNFTIADSADIRERFEIYFTENHVPQAIFIENKQANWSSDFYFSIPANTFTDEDAGDILIYEAKLSNGNDLPSWINFNSETLNFTGYSKFIGNYEITITATDLLNSSVSQNFTFEVNAILPDIQTNEAENITFNSASIGSLLNSNGGESLTSSGICWSTNNNPTISDNFNIETYFENEFSSEIFNLTANTIYYARSFAENSAGINYGNEVSFTTSSVGIIYLDGKNIILYPNPVKDILYIRTNNSDIKNVKISDIRGKIIKIVNFDKNKQSKEIDLQNFTSGIYFIEIITEKLNYTEKIVVE